MSLIILFIGDVVGSPGRKIVAQVLTRIIPRRKIGRVVCNAENAAGGAGLTTGRREELVAAGGDAAEPCTPAQGNGTVVVRRRALV